MTREEVFRRLQWSTIFTVIMALNAGAMIPQIIKLVQTQSAEGIAPTMFWIYLCAQTASMLEAIRVRSRVLFWGMATSMVVSATTISLIYYYGGA